MVKQQALGEGAGEERRHQRLALAAGAAGEPGQDPPARQHSDVGQCPSHAPHPAHSTGHQRALQSLLVTCYGTQQPLHLR